MEGYEFSYIFNKKKNKYFGIGELEKWTKEQIANHNVVLEKGNYKCQCPYCIDAYKTDSSYEGPYEKFKLYVAENLEFAHCFRCDRVFLDIHKETRLAIKTPEMQRQDISKPVYKLTGDKWSIEMFDYFDEYNQIGVRYLTKYRHKALEKLYKLLKIRFFGINPVIPFFYRKELIYFQIRYIDEKKYGKKYLNPPIEDKPAYIIEHGKNKKFVIVEGVFDAIACLLLFPDRTPFAVLQHSITGYQLGMLRSYVPEDILIFMDETKFSINVKNQIAPVINYAPITIFPSDGEDPEEYYKRTKNEEINDE